MTDIVDELRARALQGRFNLEAADEIEQMRAALSELGVTPEEARAGVARSKAIREERDALRLRIKAAEKERDALRAELDALKEQEPAGEVVLFGERLKEISWRKGKLPDVGTKLYARPIPAQSVPDGFREGAEAAARLIDQKAELYATRFGHDNTGGISFGQGPHAESKMDHYTGLLELADELRAALAAAPKPEVK